MTDTENVGGRDRLARAAGAVVLTIVAIRALRKGHRVRGLLAGIGALIFGFTSSTKYCPANDALGIDTSGGDVTIDIDEITDGIGGDATAEDTAGSASVAAASSRGRTLSCAACGEPIVPGQGRGPDENDEIVHDNCQ